MTNCKDNCDTIDSAVRQLFERIPSGYAVDIQIPDGLEGPDCAFGAGAEDAVEAAGVVASADQEALQNAVSPRS